MLFAVSHLSTVDWAVILIYLVGIIALGAAFGRDQRNTRDYFLGSKNIPWWGIGMSIVANRYPKVRAALCHDHFTARMSREHNDANVLVMGKRVIGRGVALEIVKTWLETEFAGGRHQLRLNKI